MLACIQWCWHGFVDPQDPENPFVGSITLLDGPINVLGEDYHVVHHQCEFFVVVVVVAVLLLLLLVLLLL